MAILPSQFLAIADNIAKVLTDLETLYITTDAPTDATINSGVTGATNSLLARFQALNPADQTGMMGQNWQKAVAQIAAYDTAIKNTFYSFLKEYLEAMDFDIGGVASYIQNNSLVIHPEFAAAFNWMIQNGRTLRLKLGPIPAILPASIMVPAEQSLATLSVTGATTGTFVAGTAVDGTKYGPQPLSLKNTGAAPSTGTATSFTVTYTTSIDGSQTATVTQTLTGALAASGLLALGVNGYAVMSVAVNSGGANGDTFAVTAEPARVIAY